MFIFPVMLYYQTQRTMKHETIYNLEGADILAFGLNEELVLIGAGEALILEGLKAGVYQVKAYDDDGFSQTNSECDLDVANDYIQNNLYSFAEQWIKEGRPTMTQTQYYNN